MATTTPKFCCTLEFVRPGTAIVTLVDQHGDWNGSGLVQVKSQDRQALYEQGYILACVSAASKGGRVETYGWARA
jgi:hypothetical protein